MCATASTGASLFLTDPPRGPLPNRRRWLAFALSLAVHIAGITFLIFLDETLQGIVERTPHYSVVMVPKENLEHKNVIWYDAHQSLPEISPETPIGSGQTDMGELDPHRTLIVRSEDHSSTKQLIRQPDHPDPLPADVPAPNLVVIHAENPSPPKPSPKTFVPPPTTPATPQTKSVAGMADSAPVLNANQPLPNDLGALVNPKLPPKPFVAPPAGTTRSAPIRSGPIDLSAPPVGEVQIRSGSALEALILGLEPVAGKPPQGSRSAQFANAPVAGPPSSGAPSAGAAVVAGVVSHGRPEDSVERPHAPASPIPDRRVLKEIMMPSVNRTMSAPLRPSSRVLPASVEARFANRNVYTLAIPGPNLPEYGGDWIMWFSEGESNSEARASIAAPVPAKKFTSTDISAAYSGPLVAATVQFTAVIDKNGRISSAKVLRSKAPPDFQLEAIAELNSWEFKPATRNGEPIDVEVVVEIPFQLRPVQATAR